MPRPIHFEIHSAEPERAIQFYRELFGWTFTKWDGPWPYWLIVDTTSVDALVTKIQALGRMPAAFDPATSPA